MALIKVSPPPISVRIVDENGLPTRALVEYLYRLWDRTSNPEGNVIDDAASAASGATDAANAAASLASEATELAETSIELTGNATEQLNQLAILFNQTQVAFEQHQNASNAHNSNGDIVGFDDLAKIDKPGIVMMAANVALPTGTSAGTNPNFILPAPVLYDQTFMQTVVSLLNDRNEQLNQLITDYGNMATKLNELKSALTAAGIVNE